MKKSIRKDDSQMVESRITKVQRNIITSLMQDLLNVLLTFASRIIFIKILDASYLGINGLFANILSILSFADLGMGIAMMYSLYKPLAEADTNKIRALIAFFKKMYFIIAFVIMAIGFAVLPFLNYIVKLEEPIPYLEWYYILALLNIVISYLFIYRTTLVSADQKSYVLNRYIMIFKVITFVVQTAVLIFFRNYFLYLLSALIISFISNLFQNRVALKIYPYLRDKPGNLDSQEKQRIGMDVKATFLYKISAIIQSNTDSILISIFVGTVFVGYYSNYTMIITAVVSIITLVFTSIKAGIGNLIASNDTSQKEKLLFFNILELINYWLIAFCSICFICLFQDFINIFFGQEYVLRFSTVVVIVINFYSNNIRQTIWTFREATGLFVETKYVTAVTAVINLFLSLIFGYSWGMTGIIVATVIARMVYAWWREPMILYDKFFQESVKIYYVTFAKRVCLCTVSCVVTFAICNLFPIKNIYAHFIENIIVCCIVPNVIFLICFFRTPEFFYIWRKVVRPVIEYFHK